MTFRFFLFLLATIAAHGQMPPAPKPLPVRTNHFAVAAMKDGTNSAWSNDVVSTNRAIDFTWTPSVTPGASYILGKGVAAGVYSTTNRLTTNSYTHWPAPAPPTCLTVSCGGVIFHTNDGSTSHFFTSKPTARANLWDIVDSTNYGHWRDAFTFVTASNGQLTTRNQ